MLYALKYKTRGNVSPRGKRKVYYTAYEADRKQFFDDICGDILRFQDCAIWYDSGEGEAVDEQTRENDLADMNLFVIPVTLRLLRAPECGAMRDFKYAVEHHIPVLPLMQEGGLDGIFTQVFGDVQYLDKYADDPTAITFEEKLSRFLDSVLIGDELAERIRAAFDAYIFLSYRKKDRKYARELMRLIHSNEFCRDIAIWYDEFLTPGESFNDEIADALEKSRLFALAVTPNLVNEQNYVMQVEYPMAKKSGKPILPAELVKTPKKILQNGFKEIPEPIDARDGIALSDALMKALGELAIKENDNSPEHNFFIGLAYLSGIDVEIDHKRAVRLITSSAEAGLIEAVEKITQMYRDGEGVKRDLEESVQWNRRLAELRKNEAEVGDANAVGRYLYELNNLAYRIYRISQIDESISAYRFLESEAERFSEKIDESVSLSYKVLANKWIGTMQYGEGRTEAAVETLERAIYLGKRYAALSDIGKDNLADCYSALGHAYRSVSRLTEAAEQYREAFIIREELAKGDFTEITQKALAVSYDDLGIIEAEHGNFAKAIEYYLKALLIFERVAEAVPSVDNRHSLAICLDRIASCYSVSDREKAREYFSRACEAFADVAEKTGSYGDICSMAAEYASVAHNEECIGNTEAAKLFYLRAIEIYEQIADKDLTVTALHNRAAAYSRYGDFCRRNGDLETAEKYLLLSLEIREGFDEKSGVSQVRLGKASIYSRLGTLYKQKGLIGEAKKSFNIALEIYEMLVRDGNTNAELGVGQVKKELAFIYRSEGELFKAIHMIGEAVETARTALEHKGTLDAKRNYAFSLEQYALLLFDNMRALAVKKYAEALEIYDEIARNSISKSDAGDVLRLSAWLGREYERQGNVEGAIREYERANSARYDEDGSCYELESDSERAKRCVSLGKLYMKCSEAEKASAVLYEAIELLGGCSENESDFCDARAAYGDVCLALGDAETAEEWYGDAIGGYSALFLKTHDAGYYFEIAKLYRRKAELYSGIKRKWWLKKAYKIAKMLTSKFPDEGEYTAFFRELSAEFGKK